MWSRARRSLNRLPEKVVVACVEFVHGGLSENLYRVGKPLRFDLEVPIVPAAATSGLSMRSMNRNARSESQRSSTGATYTDPIRPESRKPGRPLRAPGSAPASAMRREVRRSRGHCAGRRDNGAPRRAGFLAGAVAGLSGDSAIGRTLSTASRSCPSFCPSLEPHNGGRNGSNLSRFAVSKGFWGLWAGFQPSPKPKVESSNLSCPARPSPLRGTGM